METIVFQPVAGCSAVQLCFHLPRWLFPQFPQHDRFRHTPPNTEHHDSDEDSIQSVRAMFISLYGQAYSLFPTRCTEHLTGAEKAAAVQIITSIIMEHSSLPNLVWFLHCRDSSTKFKLYYTADLLGEHTEVLWVVWIWSFPKNVWFYQWSHIHFSV